MKGNLWALILLAAVIGLMAWWRPSVHWTAIYDPAYGDLAACQKELDTAGIANRLDSWNSGIEVDEAYVPHARAILAARGLPKFQLDRDCTGEPEQQKRMLLRESLQCLSGMEGASIRIVLPDEKAFTEEPNPPEIQINLRPGKEVDVPSVLHLAGCAFPGHDKPDVTIDGLRFSDRVPPGYSPKARQTRSAIEPNT